MYAFEIERPESLDAAVAALGREDAQPLSGGQTLIPTLKQRLASPSVLVSLTGVPELRGVEAEGGRIRLGGATTHAEAASALEDGYPALSSLAARIGDPAVRNRGTVGGSLANDDPSACWPAGALGSGGTITAHGPDGSREIDVDDFFLGMFTTALDEGEIVAALTVNVPERAAYAKFIQPASRFALVAVFAAQLASGARVAVTGASNEGVFRWREAEQRLSEDFSSRALEGLAPPDAGGMIADLHGTAAYRAHLVGVMTRRAVEEALA